MKTNQNEIPINQKNIYGYIRVSTETQADKGYGLDIQRNAIEQYCKVNNLTLVKIFVDAGKSGTIGDKDNLESRPAITELLYLLESGDSIVVMNTSRLWRDDNAKALIHMAVKKTKGEIVSIEQPHYSLYNKDPHDFLFNSMIEMLDQYERMSINQRLTKGKNEKAKQGYKPAGRAPLGYMWDLSTKKITINKIESEIVKEIFMLAQDMYTCQAIATKLNSQNKLGRKGLPWSRQSVQVILDNKFYTGILTHDGEEIKGQHESLIDTALFHKVQTRMNSKSTKTA